LAHSEPRAALYRHTPSFVAVNPALLCGFGRARADLWSLASIRSPSNPWRRRSDDTIDIGGKVTVPLGPGGGELTPRGRGGGFAENAQPRCSCLRTLTIWDTHLASPRSWRSAHSG
jgi:hypothetical protein